MAQLIRHSFDDLQREWESICTQAPARLLFSSPAWSELWWKHFAGSDDLHLASVEDKGEILGIAPLRRTVNEVRLIGSDDVCDFLDFIIKPGYEGAFFETMLEYMDISNITALNLSPLLSESTVMLHLQAIASARGWQVTSVQEDVTVYVDLPAGLSQYLALLSSKQRHELLRKERRLHEEGEVKFANSGTPDALQIDTFMRFFRESREDKRAFLTDERERFFLSLFETAGVKDMLKLGMLELNAQPVATTLCFDYRNETYLYNSGYHPAYKLLSAGLVSKYYCLKDSLENGRSRFDFLKGSEQYKYHLAGKEQPVYRCIIKR